MATRSTIAAVVTDSNGNKNVQQIYCHWDGYLDCNGRILLQHYDTQQKVEELMFHGDLSVLARYTEPDSESLHTFDAPQEGVCVYYGRDRGETGTAFKTFDSIKEYIEKCNFEEYNYIFVDGMWFFSEYDQVAFKKVEDGLKNLEDPSLVSSISKENLIGMVS